VISEENRGKISRILTGMPGGKEGNLVFKVGGKNREKSANV